MCQILPRGVRDVPNICQSVGCFWHLDSFNDLGMVAQILKFSEWSALPGSDWGI